jgi:hypothetical protein
LLEISFKFLFLKFQWYGNCSKPVASFDQDLVMTIVWIKNPLAVFTANDQDARGGVLISQGKIIELVGLNALPVKLMTKYFMQKIWSCSQA